MGFYGNIGETNNIHFQFDKIFNSRTEMDLACANGTDYIYQGRFVLVRYDNSDSIFSGEVLYGFMKQNEPDIMYLDQLLTNPYIYTPYQSVVVTSVNINSIKENYNIYFEKKNINNQNFYIKLTNNKQVIEGKVLYKKQNQSANAVGISTIIHRKNLSTEVFDGKFYICTGQDNNGKALWKLISDYEIYGDYLSNYQKDLISYGQFFDYRGYDGTVWEKVYSEGSGQYLQVARLNGSAPPAINIVEDKPTILPKSAYIDTNSSPDLYAVHVPAHWGFRFKEAVEGEAPASEFNITQDVYDENTQTIKQENFKADVYFNLKGKDHLARKFYDNVWEDEIKIRPTGYSGKKYNGQTEIDTYELSIHLPMIGNMISNGYDIIYGENEPLKDNDNEFILDENNQQIIYRPRDIEWYQGDSGLKDGGASHLGGKTYNLNTLAGTLNTFHNRLGQNIIMKNSYPSLSEIQNLEEEYIYGVEDEDEIFYYRKDIDYKYNAITEYVEIDKHLYKPNKYYIYNSLTGSYSLATEQDVSAYGNQKLYEKAIVYSTADITQLEYYPSNYYVKRLSSGRYEIATEPYSFYQTDAALSVYEKANNKVKFYKKNITASKYHEIALLPYHKDTYYYYDNTTRDYLLDHKAYIPTYPEEAYFDINIQKDGDELLVGGDILSKQTFPYSYGPGQYYKKIINNNNSISYQMVTETNPDTSLQYYKITMANVGESSETSLKILYQPNCYYYYDYNENVYVLATDTNFDSSKAPYYYIPLLETETIQGYDPETGNIVVGHPLDIANRVMYYAHEFFDLSETGVNNIKDLYIKQGGSYINASQKSLIGYKYEYCKLLTEENITSQIFIPNKYYTYNNDGFHFATSYGNSSTIYYQLKPLTPLEIPFYKADTYWYYGGNLFEIDYNIEMTVGRTYYTESPLYVLYDSANRFSKGYEWKNQALFVPASVTLATREKTYNLFPLEGINNGESSINGVIQTSGHLLSTADSDTREKDTLQGALNLFQDNFNLISMMYPDRLLYINDFGQITASSITLSELKQALDRINST